MPRHASEKDHPEDSFPMVENLANPSIRMPTCPLCSSRRLQFTFVHQGHRVETCRDCKFRLLNPQPSDAELEAIYSADYFLGDGTEENARKVSEMKQATALTYLRDVARYRGRSEGRLLEVGCGHGDFLVAAGRLGYDLTAVELSPSAVEVARRKAPEAVIHCET